MKHLIFAAAATLALSTAAMAKCSDDIKALQQTASASDAASKPGNQQGTSTPGTSSPNQGGGGKSASAKILEAQAHDQKGDEANCMKAVEEAKKEIH